MGEVTRAAYGLSPLVCRYNTETVSSEVLSRMKQQMTDVNSTGSHSFLLDDDATLPFAASDVLSTLDDKVRL
jgi:myosin-5